MFIVLKSQLAIIFGLCAFLGFLSFKPSEPYLSQYLICELDTQEDFCSGFDDITSCTSNVPCSWDATTSLCSPLTCGNVSIDDCGNSDYDYCIKDSHTCKYDKCYKNFTEDEVNDQIYPWSTYAYLPFLMVLGPGAELFSYRVAILVGICGRLVTRFLLLYGKSIADMQWMQVCIAHFSDKTCPVPIGTGVPTSQNITFIVTLIAELFVVFFLRRCPTRLVLQRRTVRA